MMNNKNIVLALSFILASCAAPISSLENNQSRALGREDEGKRGKRDIEMKNDFDDVDVNLKHQ